MHALAAFSVFVLAWPLWLKSALMLPLAWSLWHTLRPNAILGLRLSETGQVDCLLAQDLRVRALIAHNSTVFAGLIVLRLRFEDAPGIKQLVLLPDSMSAEQFRQLRVFLRWRLDLTDAA